MGTRGSKTNPTLGSSMTNKSEPIIKRSAVNPEGGQNKNATVKAESGLRGAQTTTLFRAVNFELFVKPNKVVMAFGLIALTGSVAYLAYMNASKENQKDKRMYEQYFEDGSTLMRPKRSKWD